MRHIVLIGLPGCGKSTVGAHAAGLLRAPFTDIDSLLVRRMQMPVERIFGELGEQKFRELEREAILGVLDGPPGVVAPGAGWAAQPGALEAIQGRAFLIYVKVRVTVAAERVAQGDVRPLFTGQNPMELMRVLFAEREPFYLRADAEVVNDHSGAETAGTEVARLAKQFAGW